MHLIGLIGSDRRCEEIGMITAVSDLVIDVEETYRLAGEVNPKLATSNVEFVATVLTLTDE